MKQTRRQLLKQTLALAAAGSLGMPLFARAATVLNYGGSAWLGHYPAYIAMKSGIFSRLGLDVRWQSFSTSSARMAAMMAGNLDVAGTGAVSALALMANGARQFELIATPENFGRVEGLLVRDDVNSLADLKGRKIGVTFASSSHVLLLDVLRQAGLEDARDVTIINLPASDLLAAYRSRQIDAAAAWTPQFNKIRAQTHTKVLVDDTQFSLYKAYKMTPGPDVFVARTAFAKTNGDAVKRFLQGCFEANEMIMSQPEEAAKYLVELTQLSIPEQVATLKDAEWFTLAQQKALMQQPGNFVTGLQKLAEMLVNLKQIDKAPQVKQWVRTSYL